MPRANGRKGPAKAAKASRRQALEAESGNFDALALLLSVVKIWCFAAWFYCLLAQHLAWPWFVFAVVVWIGAAWARRRRDRAHERLYGPSPPPVPYVPAYEERPRRSLGTAESILIGVLLGGLFFGGDDGEE